MNISYYGKMKLLCQVTMRKGHRIYLFVIAMITCIGIGYDRIRINIRFMKNKMILFWLFDHLIIPWEKGHNMLS